MNFSFEYQFDHVGIAVQSIDEGGKFYESLGIHKVSVEVVESEKVKVKMFELANDSRIELLEPMSTDSVIAQFLAKNGPGIHHICLRVNDIESILKVLKDEGYRLVHEKPIRGAHNCLVAFVHPKSTGEVLIELSQKME